MIALTIVILPAVWAGSIESNLRKAFNDPEWMNMEEKQ